MGGWMDYARVCERNGLKWQPFSDDPYPRNGEVPDQARALLVGDMRRMERDYLRPVYPRPPFAVRPPESDPAAVCAQATGIPIEDVRAVLAHVFTVPGPYRPHTDGIG